MIVDIIGNASHYLGLGERIAAGLRYLQETDCATVEAGRYDIDGDNLFALVMDVETEPIEKRSYEAHRRYIDIQFVVSGSERQGWAPVAAMDAGPYDEEKDLIKLTGEGSLVTLPPGTFVIYFPHDAHMPGVAVGEPAAVRKVVVKVLAE